MLKFASAMIAGVGALAPLYTQEFPIEQLTGDVVRRSYIVVLDQEAPSLFNKANVGDFLESELKVSASSVRYSYHMVPEGSRGFRGFSVLLTEDELSRLREHKSVGLVEEDTLDYDEDVPAKPDWGQSRIDRRTIPGGKPDYVDINPPNRGGKATFWIIDGGIWGDHQEFLDRETNTSRVEYGPNFASDEPDVGVFNDCRGHGTHVAGSVAGRYRGVSTEAPRLVSLRVTNCAGSGAKSSSIAAMEYALDNKQPEVANIIQMSVGGSFSQAQNDAVQAVVDGGMVFVASAGNSNDDTCGRSPAGAPAAIAVGSIAEGDTKSSFSSFGACVSVWAPGSSIDSADITGTDAYTTKSGTSMAAPLTSGAIGVLASAYNDPTEVNGVLAKQAIELCSTAGQIKELDRDSPNRLVYDRWCD